MFTKSKKGAVNVITGDEPLDLNHISEVSALLDQCVSEGQPHIVMDMSLLPWIDSRGLELLLDASAKCQQRGGLIRLSSPSPLCSDILTATGVGEHFEVFADLLDAVGSFAQ